jgi:predicted DNA-binding WGR domain protein
MAQGRVCSRVVPAPAKVPARPTKKAYRELVLARLKELRPALVEDLREHIFVFPVPEGATSLDFEVTDAAHGVPVLGYFMDERTNGQVMIPKRGGKFDAYIRVLSGVRALLPHHVLQPFVDADEDDSRSGLRPVREWFIDAWKAAGGKTLFPVRASIAFHDGEPTRLPTAARAGVKLDASSTAAPSLPRTRNLSCTEKGSSKFWRGSVDEATLTVSWGRIGTVGQRKSTKLRARDAALKELQKLAGQKLRKGYRED